MSNIELVQTDTRSIRDDRRRSPRFKANVQAELRAEGSSSAIRVETSDLSATGCYVEMMLTLEPGSRMDVVLWLDEIKVCAKGVVVTRHPHFGNGIHFVSMTEADSVRLGRFLDSLAMPTIKLTPLVQ